MKTYNSLLLIGLVARSSIASPQGGSGSGAVTDKIAPEGGAPDGCQTSTSGRFQVRTQRLSEPIIPNQQSQTSCDSDKSLVLTLADGVLTDVKGRTGYVASNYQFQFDGPPQAGSIYTAGFTLCGNNSLALGPSTVFYQCLSGTFYNLYDRNWAAQCEPILMMAMNCDAGSGSGGAPALGAGGEVTSSATTTTTTVVNEIGDGQPQAVPTQVAVPMCQIGDGQVQAHQTPCGGSPAPVVSEIGDGQPQAPVQPPAPVISQIGDGQPQAPVQPPAPVVSEISDGQPQAPYDQQPPQAPVVSEIGDGQPQAPTPGDNPPPAESPAQGGENSGAESSATSAPSSPTSSQESTQAQAPEATQSSSQAPESTQPSYEVSQGVRMLLPGVATVIVMAVAGGILFL